MRTIIRSSFILGLALIGIGFSHKIIVKKNQPEVVYDDEDQVIRKKVRRSPASVQPIPTPAPRIARPVFGVSSSRSDHDRFNDNMNVPPESEEKSGNGQIAQGPEGNYQESQGSVGYNSRQRTSRRTSPSTSARSVASTESMTSGGAIGGNGGGTFGGTTGESTGGTSGGSTGGETTGGTSGGSSGGTGGVADELTCSASIGGGTFGNPIQVGLTCSTTATITYCVQAGSCCDPSITGTVYSGPIILADDGNYCISYYGESVSKVSTVDQQSYTINNTYPDLQINYPKTYFQTTQLVAYHHLQSNDFSKPNYSIGEINMKSHDPGPLGLNMDCQDIVENYVSLTGPAPAQMFAPIDMAGIAAGNMLNIPMQQSNLAYGDNFLTSFVLNNNHAAPLYSCSTNRVNLFDFDFFVAEASHGDVGTNTVREFSGSFVSYSFFETDPNVNRTPAGSAQEDDSGQGLQVGSFGVFY